ncbi:MAG: DUF1778 domain-containing protein [Pseudomonadota bacterium]|nr:DUF1778 domain-containing protein [Pseudomonadota bacterium]
MPATARLSVTLDSADMNLLALGAALVGTTVPAFVRAAAQEKAQQLMDRQARLEMSARDTLALAQALAQPCQPNAALQRALQAASAVKRV